MAFNSFALGITNSCFKCACHSRSQKQRKENFYNHEEQFDISELESSGTRSVEVLISLSLLKTLIDWLPYIRYRSSLQLVTVLGIYMQRISVCVYMYIYTQGVSEGRVNILEGGSMNYSE